MKERESFYRQAIAGITSFQFNFFWVLATELKS